MQILVTLKDKCKYNSIMSSLGTFRKGVVTTIDSSKFDESVMEIVEEKKTEPEKKPEVKANQGKVETSISKGDKPVGKPEVKSSTKPANKPAEAPKVQYKNPVIQKNKFPVKK